MLPNASEFLAINANLLKIAFGRAFAREIRYMGEQYNFRNISKFSQNASECLQMLPKASEFLAINANLLKIAFGRAFATEIRYMGEQYNYN